MTTKPQDHLVELIGVYGGDEAHASSAWTSTNRDMSPEKIARIPKLLNMLAKDGHHTPFEKGMVHFLVTSDIATHIHCLKHRIGVSINGESARYKELKEDKFYLPDDWNVPAVNFSTEDVSYTMEKTWNEILTKYTAV